VDLASLPPRLLIRQKNPYLEVEAEDAAAFLAALSPISGFGAKLPFKTLLYRGQMHSSWGLVPTSRRKNEWPPTGSRTPAPDTWANRLIWEATSLLSFCRNADNQGLAIPNLAALRAELSLQIGHLVNGNLSIVTMWPPFEAVPALALAQHYGLPTCLLDFTWNPYCRASTINSLTTIRIPDDNYIVSSAAVGGACVISSSAACACTCLACSIR
jgi:hypothetical protein